MNALTPMRATLRPLADPACKMMQLKHDAVVTAEDAPRAHGTQGDNTGRIGHVALADLIREPKLRSAADLISIRREENLRRLTAYDPVRHLAVDSTDALHFCHDPSIRLAGCRPPQYERDRNRGG